MTLVHWTSDDFVQRLDDVLAVYGAAMEYPADLVAARRDFVASHTRQPGFRAVATLADDDRLLGFGYGYPSRPGQWWHDLVRAALDRPRCEVWLAGCFELVELHVLPEAQGRGLGGRQLVALLEDVPERVVVLGTPEVTGERSRAFGLYRRFGFSDILRDFRFPGDERLFAILGRRLPV